MLLWDIFILLFIIDFDKDKALLEEIKLLLLLWFVLCWLFIQEVEFLLLIEKWEDSTCMLDESDILIYGVVAWSS